MKAMLLAAGLGTRLRPLTETCPKPLLPLAGKAMIEYHIEALVSAGVSDLVVNVSWLGAQIEQQLGDGERFGARIAYSREPEGPLETGGGIRRALPLLGSDPFVVVAGDVWFDYPLARICARVLDAASLAHLVMVPNPAHNPNGDFLLQGAGTLRRSGGGTPCTYSGCALISPRLLDGWNDAIFPLRDPLRRAAEAGRLSGELWEGEWEDVGTIDRYRMLDRRLRDPQKP
jgi:N-acetyl-alpha-D-muramate 1-phosphate uridylyltransferase